MPILVVGVGNPLKGDDGFGVAALAAFRRQPLPDHVRCLETGIGGMHLVQELMRGYDALILFDAIDRGDAPGRVVVLDPILPGLEELSANERRDYFCETHYAVPIRALTLAREVGVLPDVVRIVGCQVADADSYGLGLDPVIAAAIPKAVQAAAELVEQLRQDFHAG